MSFNKDPASGWKDTGTWATWEPELPASYVYRLRAVDAQGKPLQIPRVCKADENGLLYIGETGPRDESERFRVARLAQGISGSRDTQPFHGAVKTARKHGLVEKLVARFPGCTFQIGWDETVDEHLFVDIDQVPAAVRTGVAGGLGVFSSTGKEIGRSAENTLLREYGRTYGELPPLNRKEGEFARDLDQKSQRDASGDFVSR